MRHLLSMSNLILSCECHSMQKAMCSCNQCSTESKNVHVTHVAGMRSTQCQKCTVTHTPSLSQMLVPARLLYNSEYCIAVAVATMPSTIQHTCEVKFCYGHYLTCRCSHCCIAETCYMHKAQLRSLYLMAAVLQHNSEYVQQHLLQAPYN